MMVKIGVIFHAIFKFYMQYQRYELTCLPKGLLVTTGKLAYISEIACWIGTALEHTFIVDGLNSLYWI